MDELVSLVIFEEGLPAQAVCDEFYNSASAADDSQYAIEHITRILVLRAELGFKFSCPRPHPIGCALIVGNLV
jgi:hypothetical protein